MTGEILIVDDTAENLRVLSELLRTHGYAVRAAPSGDFALRTVQLRRPDLILLDVRMAGMDGLETCRRLRADARLVAVPILFLSASDDTADRVAAFAAGGQDFIAKPFHAPEVLARVATHLQLAATRRELDRLNEALSGRVVAEGRRAADAESLAAERQARLELVLAAARFGIWDADPADGRVACDGRARDLFGLTPGDRPHWRDLLALVAGDGAAEATAAWERCLAGDESFACESWLQPPAPAARRRIQLRGRRLADGGMVGLAWDDTEQQVLRERGAQRDRLEAIGLLAGGVAHDLNNHLSVVIGELELLEQSSGLPAEAQRRLETISGAAECSAALVRDLLGFARRRELLRAPLDLAALARRTAALTARSLPPGVRCELDLPTYPLWATGDAAQLETALLNLCINARDAMPAGGTLRVSAARRQADGAVCELCQRPIAGDWAVIAVADSGVGIPDALRPRLFEPFFTTKGDGRGTGLGLPSVAGCVAAHDGHLVLDSAPGAGSTFALHLPLAPATPLPTPASPTADPLASRIGTVLVLDDQESVREVLVEGLRRLGWTVEGHGDPATAISAWDDARHVAALVDLAMPTMGGIEVFRVLRRRDPGARVLLMSGNADGARMAALRDQGLAGFIAKPVRLRDLDALLRRLVAEPPP